MWWSCCRTYLMNGLVVGIESVMLYAIVEMKWVVILQHPAPLKKNKLAQILLDHSQYCRLFGPCHPIQPANWLITTSFDPLNDLAYDPLMSAFHTFRDT